MNWQEPEYVKDVVFFHGSLGKSTGRLTSEIKTKVLVLHGNDDSFVSEKEVSAFQQEMKDFKTD